MESQHENIIPYNPDVFIQRVAIASIYKNKSISDLLKSEIKSLYFDAYNKFYYSHCIAINNLRKLPGNIHNSNETQILNDLFNQLGKMIEKDSIDSSAFLNSCNLLSNSKDEIIKKMSESIKLLYQEAMIKLMELDILAQDLKQKILIFNLNINDISIQVANFLNEECKNILPLLCNHATNILDNINVFIEYSALINILKSCISTSQNEYDETVNIISFDMEKASKKWQKYKAEKIHLKPGNRQTSPELKPKTYNFPFHSFIIASEAIPFPATYYKIWYQDNDDITGALNLLEDYVKKWGDIELFFTGHWNRHHTSLVRNALIAFRKKENLTIDDILSYFSRQLNCESTNPYGSLMRRLNFITQMTGRTFNLYIHNNLPAEKLIQEDKRSYQVLEI